MNEVTVSELCKIGIDYFGFMEGTSYLKFRDGTELWHNFSYVDYGGETGIDEQEEFVCYRGGQLLNVHDDVGAFCAMRKGPQSIFIMK